LFLFRKTCTDREDSKRNGTLGLSKALAILGYRPYHVVEIFANGVPHIKMMTESVSAAWLGEGKRYSREDFDKWMPEYDVSSYTPHPSDITFFPLLCRYPKYSCASKCMAYYRA
jgi:Sulfotransferase domain